MYAYIDESGDTGYTKKSTKYFILTAVIVEDCFILRRIAKDVHKYNIFNKENNILHANKDSSNVKNKLLKILKDNNIQCVTFVLKKNMFANKDLYLFGLNQFALYFKNNNIYNIIISRKDLRKTYNKKIIEIYNDYNLKAVFSDHCREKSLQIADFYSWVIFSNYEYGLSKYFIKLENNITIAKTKPSTGL